MSQEIKIDGIAIAPDVLTTIVVRSLLTLRVLPRLVITTLLQTLFRCSRPRLLLPSLPAVEATVEDDALHIVVRLTVFFGYPFKKLAEAVRVAVSKAIDAQVGVAVCAVDVCIDNLVFPKE